MGRNKVAGVLPHLGDVLWGGADELPVFGARESFDSVGSFSPDEAVAVEAATSSWSFCHPRPASIAARRSRALLRRSRGGCRGSALYRSLVAGGHGFGRWCRSAGEDDDLGVARWSDGGSSGALSRLGRRGGPVLGAEFQHGEDPRSTCHRENGFAACGGLLLRLTKPAMAMVLPRLRRRRKLVCAGPPGPCLQISFFRGVFCSFSWVHVVSRFLW